MKEDEPKEEKSDNPNPGIHHFNGTIRHEYGKIYTTNAVQQIP